VKYWYLRVVIKYDIKTQVFQFSKFTFFESKSTAPESQYSHNMLSIDQDIEHPIICHIFQSTEAEEQLIQSLQSKPKNGSARELEVLAIKLITW